MHPGELRRLRSVTTCSAGIPHDSNDHAQHRARIDPGRARRRPRRELGVQCDGGRRLAARILRGRSPRCDGDPFQRLHVPSHAPLSRDRGRHQHAVRSERRPLSGLLVRARLSHAGHAVRLDARSPREPRLLRDREPQRRQPLPEPRRLRGRPSILPRSPDRGERRRRKSLRERRRGRPARGRRSLDGRRRFAPRRRGGSAHRRGGAARGGRHESIVDRREFAGRGAGAARRRQRRLDRAAGPEFGSHVHQRARGSTTRLDQRRFALRLPRRLDSVLRQRLDLPRRSAGRDASPDARVPRRASQGRRRHRVGSGVGPPAPRRRQDWSSRSMPASRSIPRRVSSRSRQAASRRSRGP